MDFIGGNHSSSYNFTQHRIISYRNISTKEGNLTMRNSILERIKLELGNNFDLIYRDVNCKGEKITLIFMQNTVTSALVTEHIITPLTQSIRRIHSSIDVVDTVTTYSVETVTSFEKGLQAIVGGNILIVLPNTEEMVICASDPPNKREIGIPPTEKVQKGPREGFTENLGSNVGLLRKRIKSPKLKLERFSVGKESGTTVVMGYIQGNAPAELVNQIREKILQMQADYILDSNYIAEQIEPPKSFFPTVNYTEKPDIAASNILQGKVTIIVDGSPFAITLPTFLIEQFQTADDYYTNKYFATLSRLLRIFGFIVAIFLPGFYIALTTYHFPFIPIRFLTRLASSRAGIPFPTVLELVLMLSFFQLSREAALRLQQSIGSSLSIVAGLVLGQSAVEASIASQITVVVAGIYAICTFINPKLYPAIYFWSFVLIITTTMIGFPGFLISIILLITRITSLTSCNYPYAYPMGTHKAFSYNDILFRGDLTQISNTIFSTNSKNKPNEKKDEHQ